jgi:hypothetical protein
MTANTIQVRSHLFSESQEVWLRAILACEYPELNINRVDVTRNGCYATITMTVHTSCFMQTVHGTILDTLVTASYYAAVHDE